MIRLNHLVRPLAAAAVTLAAATVQAQPLPPDANANPAAQGTHALPPLGAQAPAAPSVVVQPVAVQPVTVRPVVVAQQPVPAAQSASDIAQLVAAQQATSADAQAAAQPAVQPVTQPVATQQPAADAVAQALAAQQGATAAQPPASAAAQPAAVQQPAVAPQPAAAAQPAVAPQPASAATPPATAQQTASAPAQPAAAQQPAGPFAVVNGVALPQEQLDTAVLIATRGQPGTPQLRDALKRDLITHELLRQNALKDHYDSRPEAEQAAQDARTNAAIQLYLRDNLHPQTVSDEQVTARYAAMAAQLGPQEYRPSVITVPDRITAAEVVSELKAGRPFPDLARQYSVAPTKVVGGEMPWVSFPLPVARGHTQGLPLAFAQALATLPVGGVAPAPIQAGDVWMIVKLNEKRATQIPTFDQAKPLLRQQLQAQAADQAGAKLTASLWQAAKIQQ